VVRSSLTGAEEGSIVLLVFAALTAILLLDIDPCDGLLQSENVIFSGFSRMAAAFYAVVSSHLSMWIMSYHFPRKGKRRYGTSKHCA
jgi:hypothetical protein